MKILGIDSSGMVAGAAIVDDEITIAEYTVNYKKTHSETLLPMIDEIVTMTDTDLNEIDAIAIAAGPGSFTGLRIGSATAKGLALAMEKPIISVPTCHSLAYNLWGTDKLICPIMDARRNQVYTGLYYADGSPRDVAFIDIAAGDLVVVMDQAAMGIDELIEKLNERCEPVIFLGDGVPVFCGRLDEALSVSHMYAPAFLNRQRAATVATLGMKLFKQGIYEDADTHSPIYLRKSQAERERDEKLKNECEV